MLDTREQCEKHRKSEPADDANYEVFTTVLNYYCTELLLYCSVQHAEDLTIEDDGGKRHRL